LRVGPRIIARRYKYRSAGDIAHSVTVVLRKDFIGFTRLPWRMPTASFAAIERNATSVSFGTSNLKKLSHTIIVSACYDQNRVKLTV
jgi:hypothetical protein